MSTITRPRATSIDAAIRRSLGYALVARCLAYPDESGAGAVRGAAADAGQALVGTACERLAEVAASVSHGDIEERHSRLFTFSASPDCPTFETAYLATDHLQQAQRMADLNGFYRAFGVDTVETGFRPDDICVELEFMGFLCRKEVYAAERLGAPRVGQTLRAERMFLREHLGRWGAALGRRISLRAAGDPFYSVVGDALHDWLESEREFLGVGDIDVVDAARMEWDDPNTDHVPEDGAIFDSDNVGDLR